MTEHDDGQGELDMSHGGVGGFRSQRDQQRQQEIEYYEEELSRLDDSYPCARNALELEIHRVRGGVMDMIDVVNNRKCKVRCRIAIPQDNFPGFNFVGKLLGSGGSTLKKLQEDCNVKMAILGRGSMRDPQKEQEAFESGDPKYQHLKQALHLQIDCVDAPEEAYYRISRAVYEAKNIMIPDPSELAAAAAASGYGAPGPFPPGRGGFPGGGGGPRGGRGGRGRGGRGGGAPHVPADFDGYGGGGGGFDGEAGGYRGGRGGGGRGHRGDFRGGSRGGGSRGGRGGFGGGGGDNGHSFGQDYGQSFGGGKAPPSRGRGGPAPRRGSHPYGRGM